MTSSAIAYYSAHAEQFHKSYQYDANRQQRVALWRALIGQYISHATLAYDIGCGSGVLTSVLAEYCDKVIAIDGSAAMLAVAKASSGPERSEHITFEQHTLPLPATQALATADGLICSSVLEYMDSAEEMLHFFNRLLQPEAVAIWSVSNKDSLSRRLVRFIHRITGHPRYIGLLQHFMTPETIEPLLARTGFTAVEYRYTCNADKLNRLLAHFLPERYTSNMIVVIARKA